MKEFMVIAKVEGKDYLTKVSADSLSGAEHKILDLSFCGKHRYGVEGCMAYDEKTMRTETFAYSALQAEPIQMIELEKIIEKVNHEIQREDDLEQCKNRLKKINEMISDINTELVRLTEEKKELERCLE